MKRNTRQGEVILSAIKSAGRPLTPLEIHELAVKKMPRLGIATTYRHLRTLSESNQVVGVDYPGQPPRYEWADGQDKVHLPAGAAINFLPSKIRQKTLLQQMHLRFQSSGIRSHAIRYLSQVWVI